MMRRKRLLEFLPYGLGSAIVVLLAVLVLHPAVGLTQFTSSQDQAFMVQQDASALPDYGPAPELHEGIWLNTTVPLKLADLQGQVVLLDMWTFGWINCQRVIPSLREWYETYNEQGLVVIGNHYPEFSYEHDLDNLRASLTKLEVPYPVLQDNDRETWSAYRNRYWPTLYLIDKQGNIRYVHIGEGAYDKTEQAIQTLLAEDYVPPTPIATPEAADSTPPGVESVTSETTVNVRSAPGLDNPIIGSIQSNEAYYVLAEQDGWYQINFGGPDAYVFADLVITDPQTQE